MGQSTSTGLSLYQHAVSFAAQSASSIPVDWQAITLGNELNRLPDFSYAGAFASSVALPLDQGSPDWILEPSGDGRDRTKDIQEAVYKAANRTGRGGVIELKAGTYFLSLNSTINIIGHNITLRGEPFHNANRPPTILRVNASSELSVFSMGNKDIDDPIYLNTSRSNITQDYVPVGSTFVTVFNASSFAVNQNVEIQRTISKEWIAAVGMDDLERHGRPQTWLETGSLYVQRRKIIAINETGNTLQLDFPLTDSLNATLKDNGKVVAFITPRNQTSRCSIENFSIILNKDQSGMPINETTASHPIVLQPWTYDSWVSKIMITGFLQAVHVAASAYRITLNEILMMRMSPTSNLAGYPADILIDGSQVLVYRSATIGVEGSKSFTVATGATVAGPVAIVGHRTQRPEHQIEPHARWASGVLVDDSLVGSVIMQNRGVFGSGQGWACSYSAAWNVVAIGAFGIQNPPQAVNLCIGCRGIIDLESSNQSYIYPQSQVSPQSLFLAQLQARLGETADDLFTRRIDNVSGGKKLSLSAFRQTKKSKRRRKRRRKDTQAL